MSATASPRADRRRLAFAAWACFAAAAQVSALVVPALETIGFHLVWISLSLVYGVQSWSTRRALVVLAVVVLVTGGCMDGLLTDHDVEWPELVEVPLMALVFLTMLWHVRRRAAALAEAEELAERERRAEEVKELFVRSCSHQMRTPITVARGYAELALGGTDEPAGREDLAIVLDELDKLGRLSGKLLVLADAYQSEEFEREEIDVRALLARCAQRWSLAGPRTWQVTGDPLWLLGDEAKLEAAVDALVENSLKYTVEGDAIRLACRVTDEGALVEVADSGVGFAASTTFDGPAMGRVTGGKGTGLGLAIARGIVEGHGGRLVVDDRVAQGSLVRLELPSGRLGPLSQEPQLSAHRPGLLAAVGGGTDGGKVDDPRVTVGEPPLGRRSGQAASE